MITAIHIPYTDEFPCDPRWNTIIGSFSDRNFPQLFAREIPDTTPHFDLLYPGEPLYNPEPLGIPTAPCPDFIDRSCNLADCNNLQEFLPCLEHLCPEIEDFVGATLRGESQKAYQVANIKGAFRIRLKPRGLIPYELVNSRCMLSQDLSKRLHLALSLWQFRHLPAPVWIQDFDAYLRLPHIFSKALYDTFPGFQFFVSVPLLNIDPPGNVFQLTENPRRLEQWHQEPIEWDQQTVGVKP